MPGWTEAIFLLADKLTPFRLAKEMVMPSWMLEAPAKAAWPPLLAAKGHCVRRDRRTATDTWPASVGLKMQAGRTWAWLSDQYEPVNSV